LVSADLLIELLDVSFRSPGSDVKLSGSDRQVLNTDAQSVLKDFAIGMASGLLKHAKLEKDGRLVTLYGDGTHEIRSFVSQLFGDLGSVGSDRVFGLSPTRLKALIEGYAQKGARGLLPFEPSRISIWPAYVSLRLSELVTALSETHKECLLEHFRRYRSFSNMTIVSKKK
jgi:hypothetical protein